MKRLQCVTALFMTAVALLGTPLNAEPGKSVSYWPFKQGSTWTLTTNVKNQTFDQVVTVTDVKLTKGGEVATLNYTKNGNSVQVETYLTTPQSVTRLAAGPGGTGIISPGIPIIKYPMRAGTYWDWKGKINANGALSNGTARLKVFGPTSVKTLAGTFSAFRVHSDLVVSAQGVTLNIPNDYWFAPNVGLIKQSATVAGTEFSGILKSYKLK